MSGIYHQIADGFFVAEDFIPLLKEMKLDSIEAIFAFDGGEALIKGNLATWRHRRRLQLPDGRFAYLKRYDTPPVGVQFKSWIQHGRRAFLSEYDRGPQLVVQAGVNIPQTIAFGGQWSGLFEKRSFVILLEIPKAQSLEKNLPECFGPTFRGQTELGRAARKKTFLRQAAEFVCRFHATGYRHRDLYLCHLFLSGTDTLYLIDLHRCFRPLLLGKRYALKDLAQLHYSCPAGVILRTDRLRFFLNYRGHKGLSAADKKQIMTIHRKAQRIARHDRRHGRVAPFERVSAGETVSC